MAIEAVERAKAALAELIDAVSNKDDEIANLVLEEKPISAPVLKAASALVRVHHFQVWDAVIWSAARLAGATLFLSEDLHDGLRLDGLTAINPFDHDPVALDRHFGG